MRNLKRVVSTGCFFLCLGGWVYSGQLKAEDQAIQARDALLNAAVAQAAAPETATPRGGTLLAQATVPQPAAPAASQPKTGSDILEPEIKVGPANDLELFSFAGDIDAAFRLLDKYFNKNIVTSKNVKGTVSVTLHNVTFEQALEAMGSSNGFKFIQKGNFYYIYSDQEYADILKVTHKPVNQIFHLKYMTAKDVADLIKPLLSSTGQIAMTPAALSGLAATNTDTGNMAYATDDTLVVNDFPENLANITTALKDLDVRPKQVLIEATILNASLKDANGLGIDLVSLSGLNFSDIGSIISPLSGSASTGSSSTGSTTGTTSTGVTTPGQVAGTLLPGQAASHQFDGGTNFAKDVPAGGLSIGFLSNHISFFMRALETVTDTTVVANPKILALNKQKGSVHIGQRLGYITTTLSQTTATQTVSFLDVGTTLVFRPYIADDGNIRMEIHPEDSSGVIDSHGVPQTNTTEVTANVMIKDGRTIVIGGLFSENTSAAKGQVPVLGNIPIFGIPFRSTNDATTRQETIILITPHIINDDDSLYKESLKESEDVTRMMMGNRAGLQPWGRDRLAHLWLAKAQDEHAAGRDEKALMYLDWSLNTNPRLLEAIRLREQLTHQKLDEATSSAIMDLVKNSIRGDAATTPDKGGPGVYPSEAPKPFPADNK